MELQMYSSQHQEKINRYQITEKQQQFTAPPKDAILASKDNPDRFPIVAVADGQITTFFVLHRGDGAKPYSDNPRALLIRAFSTDARLQGKGYAKQALHLLPAFTRSHFPDIDELVLAVNTANHAAQHVYQSCGFIDASVRKMGPKGELIIMHQQIDVLS